MVRVSQNTSKLIRDDMFEQMQSLPLSYDEGYVTLTHIKFDKANKVLETTDDTGIWTSKHPHQDGSTTFTALKGDVAF